MKRRDFLKRVAPASLLPFAINGQPITAYGKLFGTNAEDFTETDKVLVLVQLNGGNDGLNTIVPLNNFDTYVNKRPNIHIPKSNLIELNDSLPSLNS